MGIIDERVKNFLQVWAKRKAGELPAIDMRVTCESCGVQVMGDDAVQLTTRGLVCKRCLDNGKSI
jgi:formylmethanofuran dehydrogenase subunit E